MTCRRPEGDCIKCDGADRVEHQLSGCVSYTLFVSNISSKRRYMDRGHGEDLRTRNDGGV